MRHQDRTTHEVIAAIADGQHGCATRAQLLSAGLGRDQLVRLVRRGALIAVHRGVYRAGHAAPSRLADCMAAVLAGGPGALLAGLAAAHLLEIVRGTPPPLEIVCATERHIAGVVSRRCRDGLPPHAWSFTGIPVTSPARTLVDIAAVLPLPDLGRAVHEAQIKHRVTPSSIDAVLAGRPAAKGAGNLRRIVHGDERITLSLLERRFLALLRAERLALPVTNRKAGGRYVDCRWPELAITIELDSYTYHRSRHAWEADRAREREAYARGDSFRRFTYGDIVEHPRRAAAELRRLLPQATRRRPG